MTMWHGSGGGVRTIGSHFRPLINRSGNSKGSGAVQFSFCRFRRAGWGVWGDRKAFIGDIAKDCIAFVAKEVTCVWAHKAGISRARLMLAGGAVFLLCVCAASCGRVVDRPSSANGGPEDPSILEVERFGCSCIRASEMRRLYPDEPKPYLEGVVGDPVVSVSLFQQPVTDADLPKLARLTELRELWLDGTNVTNSGLKALAAFPNLRELVLSRTSIDGAGLKHLSVLTELRLLGLCGTRVTGADLNLLAAFKKLEVLSLDLDDLGGLPAISTLRTLEVGGSKLTDAGIREIAKLEGLRELNIPDTGVTDAGLKVVAKLRGLQKLSMTDDRVTDAGVRELAALKDLRELSLMNCKDVTDDSMRYLAPMVRLETLYLGFTRITDSGLEETPTAEKPPLPRSALHSSHRGRPSRACWHVETRAIGR